MNMRADERSLEQAVQRCVDGEMSETEQQDFLRSLDQSPSGWRNLALAFVEHQLWSQAGRAWIDEPLATVATAAEEQYSGSRRESWLHKTTLLASALLAVGMGYVAGTYWRTGSPGSSSIAKSSHTDSGRPNSAQMADMTGRHANEVMRVEWPSSTGESISLPVFDPAKLNSLRSWRDPYVPQTTVPDGAQVDIQPEFVTFPWDDQHKLVVPVRHVNVKQRVQ